jgi:hypothetical protein
MEKSNIIDMNLSICAKKKIFGKKSAVLIQWFLKYEEQWEYMNYENKM